MLLISRSSTVALFVLLSVPGFAQERAGPPSDDPPAGDGRICTAEEASHAAHPPSLIPLRVIVYPFELLGAGMEKGLVSFEQHRVRERMQMATDYLYNKGIVLNFGGMGEGTGIGLGATVTQGQGQQFRFGGRGALLTGYQEFDAVWKTPTGIGNLQVETSYQWRPRENFYGLGHDSSPDDRTNFALRQTWGGWQWEVKPRPRLRIGVEHKVTWLWTGPGTNPQFRSPDAVFPDLPGYGSDLTLQSFGAYVNADLFQGEYRWGAMADLGASYQDSLNQSDVRYFRYEAELEGRMPVAEGRSALVAQGSAELTRAQPQSDPVPFYLLPHIGGSSTLRGFPLDRYYGRNLLLVTFEYRYQIHPSVQTYVLFDEGQIFDRTNDLKLLNWHRSYGLGLRMRGRTGTVMALEFGYGKGGFAVHILFGDRQRRPLGGPIRYGTYRR